MTEYLSTDPNAGLAKTPSNPSEFLSTYSDALSKASERLGVSPRVLAAQFGLETGWGRSVIPGTNNLGNIKDFSGGGIQATDNMTGSRDRYRAYESTDAFVDDFVSLINSRYPNAKGAGDDPLKFASALKAGGYAEDPNYVSKIVGAHRQLAPAPASRNEYLSTDPNAGMAPPAQPTQKQPVQQPQPAPRNLSTNPLANIAGVFNETALQAATGMVAKPVAEIAGLGALAKELLMGGGGDPKGFKEEVQNRLTYSPRTAAGAAVAESPFNPLNVIGNVVGGAANLAGNVVGQNQSGDTLQGMLGNAAREAVPQSLALLGAKRPDLITKPILYPVNKAIDAATYVKNAVRPGPGHIMNRAAGPEQAAVVAALEKAQSPVPGRPMTVAEASLPANSPAFAALGDKVASLSPQIYNPVVGIPAQQMAAERALLGRIAGGPTQTAALDAQKLVREGMRNTILPQQQIELAAANEAGRLLPRIQARTDSLSNVATQSVQDVRRLSNAIQIADDLSQSGASNLNRANRPQVNIGMPRVGSGVSYADELSKRAEAVASIAADRSLMLGDAARFAQRQADSLAAHGLKPIDTATLQSRLAGILDDTAIAGDKTAQAAVRTVNAEIAKWAEKGGGVPDAAALHSIRTNGVRSAVEKAMPGANEAQLKARTAGLIARMNPAIDEAIIAAGGTGWRGVLDKWKRGYHGIDRMKMGAELMDRFDTNPASMVKTARGGTPEVVESVFGPRNYSISEQMGGKMGAVNKVADAIDLRAKTADMSAAGRDLMMERIKAPKAPAPGAFMPVVSAARSWVNRLTGSGLEKGLERLGPLMAENPKYAAQLMRDATPQQRAVLSGILADELMKSGAPLIPSSQQNSLLNLLQRQQ